MRGLAPDEIAAAVNLMLGRGAGGKSGISWAALAAATTATFGAAPAAEPSDGCVDAGDWVRRAAEAVAHQAEAPLSVLEVRDAFVAIGAARGRKEKERLLGELLRRADPSEAAWLARNAVGEMRAGAQEGMLLEAIASATGRPSEEIRRALIAAGDVAVVARAALVDDGAGLADLAIQVGRPIPPMLADSAQDLAEVIARHERRLAVEWKLDGARVQIHKQGNEVHLWSRRMTDVTARLPDVAALAAREVKAESAILEGEVIVFGRDGRPIPFQDVMRRWLRQNDAESAAAETPASVFLFDCLYVDGQPLIDEPYEQRWAELERVRGEIPTVERLVLDDGAEDALTAARGFYDRAIAAGHEGVMGKALAAPYAPGRRGANWLKVKAETTLDLVIVGADWGTGRRHRWLSNYHLACRDEASGKFLSVGETFKGLTDAQFGWMTEQLQARTLDHRGGYVAVRPEIVVEVLFNGVQRSTRLPSGVALRFARITRIREDKTAGEADTLARVRALLPAGDDP